MSVKRTHHQERECCLCEVILTIGIIRQTEQLYGESIHFLFVSYHILFVFLQTRQTHAQIANQHLEPSNVCQR